MDWVWTSPSCGSRANSNLPQSPAEWSATRPTTARGTESRPALCPSSARSATAGAHHNCESLFVEELLDAQNTFHVASAVHALAGAAFYRLQLRELAFPEGAAHRRAGGTKLPTSPMRKYNLSGMKLHPAYLYSCPHFFFSDSCSHRRLKGFNIVTHRKHGYEQFRLRRTAWWKRHSEPPKRKRLLKRCFS